MARRLRIDIEAGVAEPPSSPLKAAVGGMFLGSGAWIEGWRRRLTEEPVESDVPRKQQLAWGPGIEDVLKAVGQAFGVEREGVVASRVTGTVARSAAIYLARQATDEAVGAVARCFGGASLAAISKTAARVEKRRGEDKAWDERLAHSVIAIG